MRTVRIPWWLPRLRVTLAAPEKKPPAGNEGVPGGPVTATHSRDVAGEIRAVLAGEAAATADEIARQIVARTQTVRQLLACDERFRRVDPREYGRSPRASLFALADAEPTGERGDDPNPSPHLSAAADESRTSADTGSQTARTSSAFDVAAWLTGEQPDLWREERLRWLLHYGSDEDEGG